MSEIISHRVYVPAQVVPRDSEATAQFERLTGIRKTRRWDKNIGGPLRAALERQKGLFDPATIGGIVVVTQSPFFLSPCFGVMVHKILGLDKRIPVLDVNQSCDGFIYGLWLARSMAPRGELNRVLVVCFDQLRFGAKDSTESLIFSDAISITVVEPRPYEGHHFMTDGSGAEHLFLLRDNQMQMDGGKVFDFVISNVPSAIKAFEEESPNTFDFLCQHQANLSMMMMVERKTGYVGRSLRSIEEFGNQSLVSIPTALAMNEQMILGKRILLAGYGAGWCAAFTGVTWSDNPVSAIEELA